MMTFDFSTEYTLEDDQVFLRPLSMHDYGELLPYALSEPETWKYSLISAAGRDGMKKYMETAIAARAAKKEYPFIVWDKKQKAYAGSTRFYDIQIEAKALLLGYTWYGREFRGTGMNKRCKYLMLEFAFEYLGMERVEFRADKDNKLSIAAMESIGCVIEGVLRSNGVRPDGTRRDSIVLSILKSEWHGSVKEMLHRKIKMAER